MDFYDRVKALVKKNNITIETLCQQVGLTAGNYQNLRYRQSYPDFPIIIAMAKALNVSLDYLAYGFDTDKSAEKEAKKEAAVKHLEQALNEVKQL